MDDNEQGKTTGRKCACDFRFSGPGQFRNCEVYQDSLGQWWIKCPLAECGKECGDGEFFSW